ncbi:hypothetical protein [Crossiella sp. CA198]|uniref:hypothetical protein n=1 Tax=Crossiella sp. CA198 TaxID=3455607 RepID=UPI003F8D05F2
MMSEIDFYANFAASSGEVLGLGVGSKPDEWTQKLGDRFDENRFSEESLSRDFGFIGLDFLPASDQWSCDLVSLKIHKLGMNIEGWDPVPEALSDTYGKFSDRVSIDALVEPLSSMGLTLLRVRSDQLSELETLWIPETRVEIWMVRDPDFASDRGKQVGDIYTIHHHSTSEADEERLHPY